MKTKEIAFTLPAVVVLYEFFFFKSSAKTKLLYLLPVVLTALIIPFSLLLSGDQPLGKIFADLAERTRIQTNISRWDYLVTEIRVVTTYIRLLFAPINQNLDYDYPIYHSLFAPPVFLAFLCLSSICAFALHLFYVSWRRRADPSPDAAYYRLISFGILWFFITLSVESSIIPIVDVIFEHRVYLPSAGLLIATVTGILAAAKKLKMERIVLPLLILTTLVISGLTYARNTIWSSETSLWEDTVKKSPNKARPQYNLGYEYYGKGRLDEAFTQFQTALRLDPDYADAHNNLGDLYVAEGRLDEALKAFQTALRLKPDVPGTHNNLGVVYVKQGRLHDALREFQIVLRLDPDFPGARQNFEILSEVVSGTQ